MANFDREAFKKEHGGGGGGGWSEAIEDDPFAEPADKMQTA
jgi:hypothetical protein